MSLQKISLGLDFEKWNIGFVSVGNPVVLPSSFPLLGHNIESEFRVVQGVVRRDDVAIPVIVELTNAVICGAVSVAVHGFWIHA